jgi:hypothetical protein
MTGALVLLYVVDSVGNSSDGDGFSIESERQYIYYITHL